MRQLSIPGEFAVYETPPDQLEAVVRKLQQQGVRGLSVTIPHKVAVMGLTTAIDETAKRVGAINTLVFEDSEIIGRNTDALGFLRGLPEQRLASVAASRVLVLGGGGAARAVIMALVEQHANSVTLCARNEAKSAEVLNIAKAARRHLESPTQLAWLPWHVLSDLSDYDWIVNATSLGMHPDENASPLSAAQIKTLPEAALVYDLIYRPLQTRLLADCAGRGLETCNGLAMLMHQGVAAFELWSGECVPQTLCPALYETVRNALQ